MKLDLPLKEEHSLKTFYNSEGSALSILLHQQKAEKLYTVSPTFSPLDP
jgi:hypothetical protein